MNNIARRGVSALGVLVVGAAIGAGGLLTAHTAGAESPVEWAMGSDGCAYLTDGQSNYQRACPRSDGGFDFYNPDDGQWVYVASARVDANGCTVEWDNTGVLASACVVSIGGGDSGLTGLPQIDTIVTDANNQIIDTWLQPTCAYTSGDVCYVP